MNIQKSKFHLRALNNDQKIMLSALMASKGCTRNSFKWNDKSIFAYSECDYYLYIDNNLRVKFGYGDAVFNRSPFTDKTNFAI